MRVSASRKHRAAAGQNLVEMALTLPFVLIMIFFTLEVGRIWFAYQHLKMAAIEGAHAAAIFQNKTLGQMQLDYKLTASGLQIKTKKVEQVPNQHAYTAAVTATYTPSFGGLTIPSVSGPLTIFPAAFDISYTAVEDFAIY